MAGAILLRLSGELVDILREEGRKDVMPKKPLPPATVVCILCDKVLKPGHPDRISHGTCDDCLPKYRAIMRGECDLPQKPEDYLK